MDGNASAPKVKSEIKDGVGILTLNDPATLNAASFDLMAELHPATEEFFFNDEVRSIVITGEGRSFCSGANITGNRIAPRGKGPNYALIKMFNPYLTLLRKSPKPLVASINGVTAGIGVSIALACDLAVAAESAYFLLAFRRIGLVPDGGATWLLPRLVGKARAMELALLGEKLPAATAAEWGLINRCVPDSDLQAKTLELAKALAEGPGSLGLTRQLIWDALDSQWHLQLEAEAYGQGEAGRSDDAAEGIAAFAQKRPAKFTGH